MAASFDRPTLSFDAAALPTASLSSTAARRACLLAGCVASVMAGIALGRPEVLLAADAELATLLRGMAVIKGGIVALALLAMFWRLGRPATAPVAAGYLVGAWMLCAATALIWQLTWIVPAAVMFHAAELGLLVLAWRDSGGVGSRR